MSGRKGKGPATEEPIQTKIGSPKAPATGIRAIIPRRSSLSPLVTPVHWSKYPLKHYHAQSNRLIRREN